jgi:hypothetical protein
MEAKMSDATSRVAELVDSYSDMERAELVEMMEALAVEHEHLQARLRTLRPAAIFPRSEDSPETIRARGSWRAVGIAADAVEEHLQAASAAWGRSHQADGDEYGS